MNFELLLKATPLLNSICTVFVGYFLWKIDKMIHNVVDMKLSKKKEEDKIIIENAILKVKEELKRDHENIYRDHFKKIEDNIQHLSGQISKIYTIMIDKR